MTRMKPKKQAQRLPWDSPNKAVNLSNETPLQGKKMATSSLQREGSNLHLKSALMSEEYGSISTSFQYEAKNQDNYLTFTADNGRFWDARNEEETRTESENTTKVQEQEQASAAVKTSENAKNLD